MKLQKIAAFSDGNSGGNPAGVLISEKLPERSKMQVIAKEVGFSETAFAEPIEGGYKVRYFSPESEVPFCGHATIALGAALALQHGEGVFALTLLEANITVEGKREGDVISASLQSPPTHSRAAPNAVISEALKLFGLSANDINPEIPPAFANGGADHLILCLSTREALRQMAYDIESGRVFMHKHGLVTVLLGFAETPQLFHTRNPFASGGVYEDPATGAATAALAGYLRDIDWPHRGEINVVQGEDMGMRSLLKAEISPISGSSIRVSGTARLIE